MATFVEVTHLIFVVAELEHVVREIHCKQTRVVVRVVILTPHTRAAPPRRKLEF